LSKKESFDLVPCHSEGWEAMSPEPKPGSVPGLEVLGVLEELEVFGAKGDGRAKRWDSRTAASVSSLSRRPRAFNLGVRPSEAIASRKVSSPGPEASEGKSFDNACKWRRNRLATVRADNQLLQPAVRWF